MSPAVALNGGDMHCRVVGEWNEKKADLTGDGKLDRQEADSRCWPIASNWAQVFIELGR